MRLCVSAIDDAAKVILSTGQSFEELYHSSQFAFGELVAFWNSSKTIWNSVRFLVVLSSVLVASVASRTQTRSPSPFSNSHSRERYRSNPSIFRVLFFYRVRRIRADCFDERREPLFVHTPIYTAVTRQTRGRSIIKLRSIMRPLQTSRTFVSFA